MCRTNERFVRLRRLAQCKEDDDDSVNYNCSGEIFHLSVAIAADISLCPTFAQLRRARNESATNRTGTHSFGLLIALEIDKRDNKMKFSFDNGERSQNTSHLVTNRLMSDSVMFSAVTLGQLVAPYRQIASIYALFQ